MAAPDSSLQSLLSVAGLLARYRLITRNERAFLKEIILDGNQDELAKIRQCFLAEADTLDAAGGGARVSLYRSL